VRQPIGTILDQQGLEADLDDGDLIDGAMVLVRVRRANGDTTVKSLTTDGMDFITRRALVEIARDGEVLPRDAFEPEGDDQ